MNNKVIVPQDDIDKIEQARKDICWLFSNADSKISVELLKITVPIWELTHKRYPEYEYVEKN